MTGTKHSARIEIYYKNHHNIFKCLEELTNAIINKNRKPKSILDINCGDGILTRVLAKKYKNANIVGIDSCKEKIDIANSTFTPINVTYKTLYSHKACKLKGKFDLIVFKDFNYDETISYKLFKKILNLLNQDGEVFIISDKENIKLDINLDKYKIKNKKHKLKLNISENFIHENIFNINKKLIESNFISSNMVLSEHKYNIIKIKK